LALTLLVASGIPTAASASPKIDARVEAQLDQQGAASFWIVLASKADLTAAPSIGSWTERGAFVLNHLTAHADSSQRGLRAFLQERGISIRPFWIANAILVYQADAATAYAAAARPEVSKILPRWQGHIVDGKPGVRITGPDTVEWNLTNIGAPDVWTRFDDRGDGIVVANIDTGVQYNHPALVNQYRGNLGNGTFDHDYNHFDPLSWCPTRAPCDTFGHGTHTMGTMVGDDGGQNQIGVAPQAQWIEANALPDGNGTDESLLGAGQWIVAPTDLHGQNPRPDLRPDIVSNSWGIPFDDSDIWYQATVQAWIASGIFPAWAAGNEGPSCSSLRQPGAYPESYTMGAHDINNNIASFSSRGPSPFDGGTIKPDITAPGVNVRSSYPTNGYAVLSGTSMATPHVAATVALMWSEVPALRHNIQATEKVLSLTAHPVNNTSCGGTMTFNNVWGHGRLDALDAVRKARSRYGS
jgi:subtilisin family serine protease